MMWPGRALGELSTITRGSSPRPIADTRYFEGGTIPWIKIADATKSGKFLYETKEHVNEYGASFSKILPAGTILVAASGTLGYTQILGVEGCAHDGWLILQNLNGLDRDFAYYALKTVERHFFNSASGAAIQNINTDILRKTEIPCPPLPVQQHIAGILSAYDELIENNQRRISILEDMARSLYREWFVHFRYPGHESVPLVDSPLGQIPQGWEVKRIGDTFQTVLGGTPSRTKPEFWENGSVPWINSGKVNDLRITEPSELITELALQKLAAKLMPKGTTVLAITGATLGQVSYLEIETTANQSVVGIVDTSGQMSEWIYLNISEQIEGIIKQASGGAQQHINKEIVNDVLIALPSPALATRFKVAVGPMFKEVASLLYQIQNLRRTRDLLLPRLLSGQVSLTVLESEQDEVMP